VSAGREEAIQSSPSSQNQRLSLHATTPQTNGKSHSGKDPGALVKHMTPFGQRAAKFTPHFVFNAHNCANELTKQELNNSDEDEIIRRVQPGQKCSLNVISSEPQMGCLFMYDRTEDRASTNLNFFIKIRP
jgi:DNA polymerase alpha subunit B